MSSEKASSVIGKIIDFVFGAADPQEEAAQEKSAAIIYEFMDFISRQKDSGNQSFKLNFFCSSIKKENFSCAEAVQFGVGQGWIAEAEDEIRITEYGFSYEKDFWKSFR